VGLASPSSSNILSTSRVFRGHFRVHVGADLIRQWLLATEKHCPPPRQLGISIEMVLGLSSLRTHRCGLWFCSSRRIRGDGAYGRAGPRFIEFVRDCWIRNSEKIGRQKANWHETFTHRLFAQPDGSSSKVCYETRCSHARRASPPPTMRRTCAQIVQVCFLFFLSNKLAFPSLVSEESKEKASHYCEWVIHDLLYEWPSEKKLPS